MKILSIISERIAYLSQKIAFIILASVSSVLILQVLLRTVFNSGITWADEFARFGVIWAVMLIANVLVKDKELIAVDFLDDYWPKSFLKWRDTFYTLIFFVITILLIYYGFVQALDGMKSTTSAMRIKWFYPYLAIPVGMLLVLYQFFYNFVNSITLKGKET